MNNPAYRVLPGVPADHRLTAERHTDTRFAPTRFLYDDSVSFRAFNYYTNTFYGVNDKTYSLTGDSDESIQPVPIDWPIDPPVYPPITPPIIVDPPVIVEPSGSETVG